jgi:hypothetical protein
MPSPEIAEYERKKYAEYKWDCGEHNQYRPYFVENEFAEIPFPGNEEASEEINYHSFIRSKDFPRAVQKNGKVMILIKKEFAQYSAPKDRELKELMESSKYRKNMKAMADLMSKNKSKIIRKREIPDWELSL